MPIAFVETMRGALRDLEGRERPLDFHLRAVGGPGGRFTLSGVVHASPWAEETVAWGTLVFSAWPAALTYDVRFRAGDGRTLRLHGAKTPSLRQPLASMTALPVNLSDEEGRQLGRGTLRFDLMDLPSLVVSWLPLPTRPHRQLEARRVAVARRELV
jgi:hypothetical protein